MHSHLDAEYDACLLADIIGVAQSSVPSLEEFMNTVGIGDRERTSRIDISRREAASFCGDHRWIRWWCVCRFYEGNRRRQQLFFLDLKLKYASKEKYCQQHSLLSVATWFSMRRSSNFNEIRPRLRKLSPGHESHLWGSIKATTFVSRTCISDSR